MTAGHSNMREKIYKAHAYNQMTTDKPNDKMTTTNINMMMDNNNVFTSTATLIN